MMLNFYRIRGDGKYASGMVLIAANSEEEAIKLANGGTTFGYGIKYLKSNIRVIEDLIDNSLHGKARVVMRHEFGE